MHIKDKKVIFLYRVSTDKQLDDEDIPMQQRAKDKMLEQHPDWILCDEYFERGVSAYKTAVSDRDILQKIIKKAETCEFDILALFSPDRLCRIQDDYTPVLRKLSKYIEVWTYTSGDITIRNHIDALKASIDGWSNEGESIKISIRTDEKHKQMAEDGLFRGGSVPYGYKLIQSGRYSKRDKKQRKELFDIVVDEDEAKIVKLIFNLAYEYGYGGGRIAKYLTEQNLHTRNNGFWTMTSVDYMLKNPIYKGYPAYGKSSNKKTKTQYNQPKEKWVLPREKVDKLAIISEEMWNTINIERSQRKPHDKHKQINTDSELLFSGIIKCGHCNSPLVTAHHIKNYTKKDGTLTKTNKAKYRCSGKQKNVHLCDGGSIYDKEKIEKPALEFIFEWLEQFGKQIIPNDFYADQNDLIKLNKKKLMEYNKQREQKYKEITALNNEIPKTIMGESPFTKEQLSELIKERMKELEKIKEKCIELENKVDLLDGEEKHINVLKEIALTFPELYNNSPLPKKKKLLKMIIESITVFKKNDKISLDIEININLQRVLPMLNGMQSHIRCAPTLYEMTHINNYIKQLKFEIDNYEKVS